MIKLEERMKLFEEIGMTSMVEKINTEKEMKEQAGKLTALKLISTSQERIKKQICGKYWRFNWTSDDSLKMGLGNIIAIVVCFLACVVRNAEDISMIYGGMAGATLFNLGAWIYSCRKKSKLEWMTLSAWKDNIPTGALYAVKEAKEKGVTDFGIYFPVTQERHRLKTDPVIVGWFGRKVAERQCSGLCYHNLSTAQLNATTYGPKHTHSTEITPGKMVEIFAWDDGKVYE